MSDTELTLNIEMNDDIIEKLLTFLKENDKYKDLTIGQQSVEIKRNVSFKDNSDRSDSDTFNTSMMFNRKRSNAKVSFGEQEVFQDLGIS